MIFSGHKNTVGLLIFIAVCILRFSSGLVLLDSDENVSPNINIDSGKHSNKLLKRRRAREVNNCGMWSEWKNDHKPTPFDKNDHEAFTPSEITNFCPKGTVGKFECRDDKGEGFNGNRTAPDSTYAISCIDFNVGVICTELDPKLKQCPDMSIRYKCSCTDVNLHGVVQAPVRTGTPIPVTSRVTGTPMTKMAASPSNTLTGALTQNVETSLNIGGLSIPWWVFVLVVSVVFFLISLCVSVCLYKKATNQMDMNRKSKTVHPLQSV